MVVLQLHFLYLSNGNFVLQKEQIKLVGAELPGGVGGGVDLDAFSSVITVSSSFGCLEVFIIWFYVLYFTVVVYDLIIFPVRFSSKKQKNTMMERHTHVAVFTGL